MKINRRKFEPAVHLGLLVIIFVLLFMNFRSNLTIYHAGTQKRKTVTVGLNYVALSISRTIQKQGLSRIDREFERSFRQNHQLNSAVLLAASSARESSASLQMLLRTDSGALSRIGDSNQTVFLAPSAFKSLIRGTESEYHYVYPIGEGARFRVLVLSQDVPELAYLEDSSKTLIIVNLVAVSLIIILYLFLFRLILSPFKKIRRQAIDAGRYVTEAPGDVDGMVDEYQKIINELKEKESQLLTLNQAIQEKVDRLELFNQYLLRSMSSGIIIVDGEGILLSINAAAGQMLHLDPESFVGRGYHQLPGYCGSVLEQVRSMLESDENQSYREYDMEMPGQRILSVGVNISSIHDYTSSKVGVSILINDLTEIKNLRGEVEARNRLVALGEMASGLAHQLRNSLGAITGYSHLVKKRLTKHGLELDSITALEDEAGEADLLVDRFLSFARPFDLAAGETDVAALVVDLMETFKVRRENALIEFMVADEMPPGVYAQVDTLLIKQALANLIENAVNSYEGCGGLVKVGLSLNSGFVTIQVSDDGCGIAAGDLEKIFTPFFSSRPSGTGLGLPLAKKIIDLHHGRLTVSSRLASGTTFTAMLPLHQPGQKPSSREPASRQV